MIPLPPLTRIFLACGAIDKRKGFDGLAVLVQQALKSLKNIRTNIYCFPLTEGRDPKVSL